MMYSIYRCQSLLKFIYRFGLLGFVWYVKVVMICSFEFSLVLFSWKDWCIFCTQIERHIIKTMQVVWHQHWDSYSEKYGFILHWGVTRISLRKSANEAVSTQTMIEAHVDVKTTDGYLLRLFCVGFTKKRTNQIRKTSYAQHQQVRQIRKKMMEIMTREVQTNDLKEVVNKL